MTVCCECRVDKPRDAFHANSRRPNGLASRCRPCRKIAQRESYLRNIDARRAYARAQSSSPTYRARVDAATRRLEIKYGPGYRKARTAVYYAVKGGRLIRPSTCSRCPRTDRISAHHDDYARPLDVMWFCPSCHANRHRELGRLKGTAT